MQRKNVHHIGIFNKNLINGVVGCFFLPIKEQKKHIKLVFDDSFLYIKLVVH
jgi:hypothetical protein